jgi:hypothetical protein
VNRYTGGFIYHQQIVVLVQNRYIKIDASVFASNGRQRGIDGNDRARFQDLRRFARADDAVLFDQSASLVPSDFERVGDETIGSYFA